MDTNWMQIKQAIKSGNVNEKHEALVTIRDSIIGSNKQKSLLISNQMVEDIIQVCYEDNITNKIEALVIIGSLTKGLKHHVRTLVDNYDIINLLKKELTFENSKHCVEICLGALCSISEQDFMPTEYLFKDDVSISYFLGLASTMGNSLKSQIYITSILCSLCRTKKDQINFLNAGVVPFLARLIYIEEERIRLPALKCLRCMCFANRSVSDIICVTSFQGRSLTDILSYLMARSFSPNIQLESARCMTYIYRSGTLPSTDFRIYHRTLPCLVRLCLEDYRMCIRVSAAETLAVLIEVDAKLQQLAVICNHLLKSLFQLIKVNDANIKQAALKCIAALGANDEAIRKKITEIKSLVDTIVQSLNDWDSRVRIAAVICLHSLSRSVQQLRTTFQDHSVWEQLLFIMNNELSVECLIAVTATFCNLLLEFSPSKTPLLNSGIIEKLCVLVEHDNESVRLNSLWALMNLTYQSDKSVKQSVLNIVGIKAILKNLTNSNTQIVMKTLGTLRNLLSQPQEINMIIPMYSTDVMDALYAILVSDTTTEIKEQILCLIGSFISGLITIDYIMNNEKLLNLIGEFLFHADKRIQSGALYIIHNIVLRTDVLSEKSSLRLTKFRAFQNIVELSKSTENVQNDYINRTLKKIVIKIKSLFPDIND